MPDSLIYFIAGYALVFGLLAAYIGWLALEARRIKKREQEQQR